MLNANIGLPRIISSVIPSCHTGISITAGDRVAVCGWGGSALKLDQVVSEVKESEEWEGVKMSILSVGIEKGNAEGMI